jgi:UDP-GlcNAc3NAcA epimerase
MDFHLPGNIHIVEPVGYLEMVWLETRAMLVATDSGGVQKEAFFHGKPCITLRDETEWVELVTSGWNRLVGSDSEKIAAAIAAYAVPERRADFYGDGRSATHILEGIFQ